MISEYIIKSPDNFLVIAGFVHAGKTFLENSLFNHEQVYPTRVTYGKFYKSYTDGKLSAFKRKNKCVLVTNPLSVSHCDKELFDQVKTVTLVRDPRIIWFLTTHYRKKDSREQAESLCEDLNRYYLTVYEKIKDYPTNLILRFEDLLLDYETAIKEILNHCNLNCQVIPDKWSSIANSFYTSNDTSSDVYRSCIPDQKILNLVSDKMKDYINEFGYQQNMLVSQIARPDILNTKIVKKKSIITKIIPEPNEKIGFGLHFLQKRKFFKSFLCIMQFPHGGKTFLKRTLQGHSKISDQQLDFESLRYLDKNKNTEDGVKLVFYQSIFKQIQIDNYIVKNSNCMFISRDPRIIWYLCNWEGKKTGDQGIYNAKDFCDRIKRYMKRYNVFSKRDECKNYLELKYEDILNPDTYVDSINKIIKHAKLKPQYLKPFHELRCKYFNAFDVRSRFFKIIKPEQKILDLISETLKEEIEYFGYPEYFDKEEIEKYRRMYNE